MKKYTFNQWLKEWLKVYKEPYIKTSNNLKIIIRLHIPQELKDTLLKDLTAIDLQKCINGIKSTRTAIDVYDILKASLSLAYKLELMKKDITAFLIKPKHIRKQGQALSAQELVEFLTKINNARYENFYLFCLYSGCRRSEALNMTWNDID